MNEQEFFAELQQLVRDGVRFGIYAGLYIRTTDNPHRSPITALCFAKTGRHFCPAAGMLAADLIGLDRAVASRFDGAADSRNHPDRPRLLAELH